MTQEKIEKIIQTPYNNNDQWWFFQETENKKWVLTEAMNAEDIVDTIEIFEVNKKYWEEIKKEITKINPSSLRDVTIIDISYQKNEKSLKRDFTWLEIALEKLMQNPNKKIILTTVIPVDIFLAPPTIDENGKEKRIIDEDKQNKLKILLAKPTVRIVQLPCKIQDFIEAFKTQEIQEPKEKIIDTMEFYEVAWRYPYLKEFFSELNIPTLKNSVVVDLRADEESKWWWKDMSWLKIAKETIKKDANAKIILCSVIPVDVLKKVIEWTKSAEYLNELLKGKNVRLIQSSWGNSMTEEEVIKSIENLYTGEEDVSVDTQKTFKQISLMESEKAFHDLLEREIGSFLHGARYNIPDCEDLDNFQQLEFLFKQKKVDKELLNFQNKMVGLLQLQHPSYKKVSRERNLWGILSMYEFVMHEELPEWTRFEGVYVDRDWCLYNNEKQEFNTKVLDMIQQYQKEGKKITIRTLGNLEIKQKQLDEAGLPYTVKNKIDYKWGTIEIVIDDETPEKLLANARVKGEKYIKI